MSEIINPTSSHVTKRVSQPAHVLESIPSFAFDFRVYPTDEPVNNRGMSFVVTIASFTYSFVLKSFMFMYPVSLTQQVQA